MTNQKLLLAIYISLVLLFEGTGIRYGREIAYEMIIVFPFFLLLQKSRLEVLIKRNEITLFSLFTIFSLFSTFHARHIMPSLLLILFYFSCLLSFYLIQKNKDTISKLIIPVIFATSSIFCILSMIVIVLPELAPIGGFQLIFSFYGSHNHLGDFLLLPLTACFYFLLNKRDKINTLLAFLSVIFFSPFFLFSFSRSAYLSLIVVLAMMLFAFYKKRIVSNKMWATLFLVISIGVLSLFLFSLYITPGQKNIFTKVNSFLKYNNNLAYKAPYGARGEYIREAIFGIYDNPILGIGPGNFIEVSKKYNPIHGLWAESSHNIFMDILVENGIPAGIIFILIIIEALKKSEKNIFFFMVIALLMNFQTDYSFRIYSMTFLFFILLGSCYRQKTTHS